MKNHVNEYEDFSVSVLHTLIEAGCIEICSFYLNMSAIDTVYNTIRITHD